MCGVDEEGVEIVESWTVEVPPGGWVVTRLVSTAAIGRPVDTPSPSVSLNGSPFLHPASRGESRVVRRELFRSSDLGGILSVQVDPDGRYLLLLTRDRKLHQVAMDGAPVAPPVDLASLFEGYESTLLVGVRDHARLGRVYSVGPGIFRLLLLIDAENDGVLDSWLDLTHEQYQAIPDEWRSHVRHP